MQFHDYQRHLSALTHGKCLPTAIYVFRETGSNYGAELNQLVAMLAAQCELRDEFNVVKFRTDELKVSFLSYPGFMEDPHPRVLWELHTRIGKGY